MYGTVTVNKFYVKVFIHKSAYFFLSADGPSTMRFRNWTCGSYGTTAVEEGGKEGAEAAEAVVEEATMFRVCFRMLSGTAGSGRNSRSSGKAIVQAKYFISANLQRHHS